MEQAQSFKRVALVVEEDARQRASIVTLLEESDVQVIQCESGEAAELVLDHVGGCLIALIADADLAGRMDGFELAQLAKRRLPDLRVLIVSVNSRVGRLPDGTQFLAKPLSPLDLLRETLHSS
jgi:two-component system, cell cycle response regulator CpdR